MTRSMAIWRSRHREKDAGVGTGDGSMTEFMAGQIVSVRAEVKTEYACKNKEGWELQSRARTRGEA